MDTLLLTRDQWDLCLDASGNIAVASNPYALAQDAASAIKLFVGELWYDTTQGVPYFETILGRPPSLAFMKARFVAAALTVPEVASATCYITGIVDRKLSGQVQVTSTSGVVAVTSFSPPPTTPMGFLGDPSGGFVGDPSGGFVASP